MRLGVEAAIVDGMLLPGDVEIADGRIAEVALAGSRGSGIAVPGFVDLQVNGFGGVDFATTDTAGYRRAGEALLATGVTAFQPTLITAPEDDLVAALAEVPAEAPARGSSASISKARSSRRAASARISPPPAATPIPRCSGRLLDAGPVTYVTLAPELPGALDLVDLLHARGDRRLLRASDATVAQANAAFDRGVGTVTHLFNAMRPLSHRDPGIVGAALVREDVIVQAILDGHHLADETARVVWRAAAGRVALVTDAVAATGPSGGERSSASSAAGARRGRPPGGRRARRQRPDHAAGRAEPPPARRAAARRGRGRDRGARARAGARGSRRAPPRRCRRRGRAGRPTRRPGPCSLREASGSPPESRTNMRRCPTDRAGLRRRVTDVPQPVHRPTGEIEVEEIPGRADDELDGAGHSGSEQLEPSRIGPAVRSGSIAQMHRRA